VATAARRRARAPLGQWDCRVWLGRGGL